MIQQLEGSANYTILGQTWQTKFQYLPVLWQVPAYQSSSSVQRLLNCFSQWANLIAISSSLSNGMSEDTAIIETVDMISYSITYICMWGIARVSMNTNVRCHKKINDRPYKCLWSFQLITPCVCARGKVIGLSVCCRHQITRYRVLGICACCKHNQSIDIGKKLVCTRFELLKKAYWCYKV